MWHKFQGASYTRWENIDEAIRNCTPVNDFGEKYGLEQRSAKCWTILDCALSAADAIQQAQFSSAATILGLLPTVLSIISTSTDDLLRVHRRFPILAFLLSLSNPSTMSATLSSPPTANSLLHTERSAGLRNLLSQGLKIPRLNVHISMAFWFHDLVLHVLASGCATMAIYQSLNLGLKGVIVFACWTWWNPVTWVSVGGFVHILSAVSWRLCIGPASKSGASQLWARWHYSIPRSGSNLDIKFPRMARFIALAFQIVGIMNYGYGTVLLSGTTLVHPNVALRIFTLMGFAGVLARLIVIWLLDVYPDVEVRSDEVLREERREGVLVVEPKYQPL